MYGNALIKPVETCIIIETTDTMMNNTFRIRITRFVDFVLGVNGRCISNINYVMSHVKYCQ